MFNTYNPRAASVYQRINVETSMHTIDQHHLVSLLFDGVMDAITSARGALVRGDVPLKCNSIAKAIRILDEGLSTALDRDAGGELAVNLGDLYSYCLKRLIQANVHNDDAILAEVGRLIEQVALGWNEIKKPAPERVRAPGTVTMEA